VKEKELRLALVCYGGISLAVYMHGITKEVLKLARASRLFHSNPDRTQREQARFEDLKDKIPDEVDSEEVYFDLLKVIGEKLDLRVVVDSIAGASAGGINGIILARALAHDLSIDHMRSAWIDEADVVKLTAPSNLARPWSKFILQPDPMGRLPDAEIRTRQGSGDPDQAVDLPAVALVQAALRRPAFPGPAVRRDEDDAQSRPCGSQRLVAAGRPCTRSLRDPDRLLRLFTSHRDQQPAHHPGARA